VLFLLVNGTELIADPAALADITLATARGEMSAEALAIWFRQRSRPLEP
jgi:prophage maintenance system killer protein